MSKTILGASAYLSHNALVKHVTSEFKRMFGCEHENAERLAEARLEGDGAPVEDDDEKA